jgi:hypothetical protein
MGTVKRKLGKRKSTLFCETGLNKLVTKHFFYDCNSFPSTVYLSFKSSAAVLVLIHNLKCSFCHKMFKNTFKKGKWKGAKVFILSSCYIKHKEILLLILGTWVLQICSKILFCKL